MLKENIEHNETDCICLDHWAYYPLPIYTELIQLLHKTTLVCCIRSSSMPSSITLKAVGYGFISLYTVIFCSSVIHGQPLPVLCERCPPGWHCVTQNRVEGKLDAVFIYLVSTWDWIAETQFDSIIHKTYPVFSGVESTGNFIPLLVVGV